MLHFPQKVTILAFNFAHINKSDHMKIEKKQRAFVENNLVIDSWNSIESYYKNLAERPLLTQTDFDTWLSDRSELDAILEEDAAWRYIKMTVDTTKEELTKAYTFFVTEIQPKLAPWEDKLNKKFIDSSFSDPTNKPTEFKIYHRSVSSALRLFREENIPLEATINEKSQEFGSISGAQTIQHEGNTITMQKAATFLKNKNEDVRKAVFEKMMERRSEDIDKLDNLFTELVQLRHQVATNAGFKSFRDYKFEALGRFDYTVKDCVDFHSAIKSEIVPIVKQMQQQKLEKLNKDKFKPWDLDFDSDGLEPLKPFEDGDEMLKGTISLLNKIDPFFGESIQTMADMNYLDLDSKPGKAPGGYNYPLYEIGVPFIFMNAVGAQRDLVTMVHESGHAVHSFLSRDLKLTSYKNVPSEVAELASMAMELLSMEEWSAFYDENDVKRAKREQIETMLKILPWVATIDEFQHWIYENPFHSKEERTQKWIELGVEYGTGLTDWTGYESSRETAWQRQMHLFEVPFYYIEYGFAQLGAIGVWKNSLTDFKQTIENYKSALTLGYTRSIPEIYEVAGVKFDFSQKYIKDTAAFLKEQLSQL